MEKLKLPTNELKIGDQFKLRDEVTRAQNIYEITSELRPITSNPAFSHFVECDCKDIKIKPHPTDCECGNCIQPLDTMMWIDGEIVNITRNNPCLPVYYKTH